MPDLPVSDFYTAIIIFGISPERQEELVAAIAGEIERWVCDQPGFVSATLHKSEDGIRVCNYARWRSREDWQAFSDHPENEVLAAKIAAVGPTSREGRNYHVARSFAAPGAPG